MTVRKIVTVADGRPAATLAGAKLTELMEPFGVVDEKTTRTTIAPGGTTKVLMDLTYPAGHKPPRKLDQGFVVSPAHASSVELSRNSNAPHLHFQLMDGPTPLGSEGLPFRFSAFTAEGTLTNFPQFFVLGAKAKLAGAPLGHKRAELPLNLQVIDFGP